LGHPLSTRKRRKRRRRRKRRPEDLRRSHVRSWWHVRGD
jgi:hypothetical protein